MRSPTAAVQALLIVLAVSFGLSNRGHTQNESWTEPFPAHRIAGNLYYVGSRDLASYLITTEKGHILINSSLRESVPLIESSVQSLGFKFTDIQILLISHAHSDHCAGSAAIVAATKARHYVMEEDAEAVETGGRQTSKSGASYLQFPPTKVDRRLKDGDEVRLGPSVLTARRTAGHTKGCTTWCLEVEEKGHLLKAVIIGSPNVNPGYLLVDNASYPQIAADYRQTFQTLKSLPVDLFLGAHGGYYGLTEKHARLRSAPSNPFIDPKGYQSYVNERETAFLNELKEQQSRLH